MTQDPIVPSADLCEYLYANNYDIDEIFPECNSLETITQLSSDQETRSLIRGLTGHDHFIDAQHIQKNRLDQLCCTDVTRKWTPAQMAKVEKIFISRGWLQQKRWYPCDFPFDPNASFTVSVRGDPNIGKVVFIRDYHKPSSPTPLQILGDEVKTMLDTYKLKTLQALLKFHPTHVFVENSFESWTVEQVHQQRKELEDIGALDAMRKDILSDSLDGPPTVRQLRILDTIVYIQLVYALISSEDVAVCGTTSVDGQVRNKALLKRALRHDEISEEERIQAMAVMEAEALDRVMEVLRVHPGARVALIFGATHEFRDDFERLPNPPTVLTLHFEKLGKSIMEHPNALKL